MYPSNWTLMKHATSINPHVPSSMFRVLKPCLFDCSDIFRSSIWFTCGKITHVGIGRVAAGFQQSFSIPTLGVAHSSNRMDWTLDARQPMKAACVLDTLIVMEIPQGLAPVLWHIDNFTSRHFPSTESCSVARIELQQPSAPRFTIFLPTKHPSAGPRRSLRCAKDEKCDRWRVGPTSTLGNQGMFLAAGCVPSGVITGGKIIFRSGRWPGIKVATRPVGSLDLEIGVGSLKHCKDLNMFYYIMSYEGLLVLVGQVDDSLSILVDYCPSSHKPNSMCTL